MNESLRKSIVDIGIRNVVYRDIVLGHLRSIIGKYIEKPDMLKGYLLLLIGEVEGKYVEGDGLNLLYTNSRYILPTIEGKKIAPGRVKSCISRIIANYLSDIEDPNLRQHVWNLCLIQIQKEIVEALNK